MYVTGNGAYTWTAAVQETVDATLNRTVSSGKAVYCYACLCSLWDLSIPCICSVLDGAPMWHMLVGPGVSRARRVLLDMSQMCLQIERIFL